MVELQEGGGTWVVLKTRSPGVMGVCEFVWQRGKWCGVCCSESDSGQVLRIVGESIRYHGVCVVVAVMLWLECLVDRHGGQVCGKRDHLRAECRVQSSPSALRCASLVRRVPSVGRRPPLGLPLWSVHGGREPCDSSKLPLAELGPTPTRNSVPSWSAKRTGDKDESD